MKKVGEKELFEKMKSMMNGWEETELTTVFYELAKKWNNLSERERGEAIIGCQAFLGVVMSDMCGDLKPSRAFSKAYKLFPVTDHPSLYKDSNGKLVSIQHPYNLGVEQLQNILCICRDNNIHLSIDGLSEYYPAHSFRIVMTQK